jgi:hypothetical protein
MRVLAKQAEGEAHARAAGTELPLPDQPALRVRMLTGPAAATTGLAPRGGNPLSRRS